MMSMWQTNKGMSIEALGNSHFIFQFNHEEDKRRIYTGEPWHHDNSLIILAEPKGIGDINKIDF